MRINSRKIQKILGKIWIAPKRLFDTFCTQEPLDASAWMQHSLNFVLIRKIKQRFFLYYIPCKENKCWEKIKIMRKVLFNYSFYSHPEIGNFRVWHRQKLRASAWVWRGTSWGRSERGGSATRPGPKFGGSRFRPCQWRQAPEHNLLLLTYAILYAMLVHLHSGVELKP
jgi:hypothetical protein